MIRALAIIAFLLAILFAVLPHAHAKDNNPFSGATSIEVAMTRDAKPAHAAPLVRLHCADPDGIIVADWRVQDGRFRLKLGTERKWSAVPADTVAVMILMLQFEGAPCAIVKPK